MAKNKRKPYKSKEFEMFVVWKSLPPIYRGHSRETLEKLGIDSPEALDLVDIKTQTEFGKKYGVDNGTMSDWSKRIYEEKLTEQNWSRNFKSVVGNATMLLATNMVKNPSPNGIRVLNDLAFKEGYIRERKGLLNKEEVKKLIEKTVNERGPLLILHDNSEKEMEKYRAEMEAETDRILDLAYGNEELPPADPGSWKERIAKLQPPKIQ